MGGIVKGVAPGVTQVAVLRDTSSSAGIGQFAVVQAFARPLGLEVSTINAGDPREMDGAVTEFAREPNGGLIVNGVSIDCGSSRSDHRPRGSA